MKDNIAQMKEKLKKGKRTTNLQVEKINQENNKQVRMKE